MSEDWTDDPDEFAAVTDALGMHDRPPTCGGQSASNDPRPQPLRLGRKTPCEGSAPQLDEGAQVNKLPQNPEDQEGRLNKLGEVTLDGFEKINQRLVALERGGPAQSPFAGLGLTCKYIGLGYVGFMLLMTAIAVIFHVVGITK